MANNLFVSYDLFQPGQNYETVIAEIKKLGNWAKVHYSLWYVRSQLLCHIRDIGKTRLPECLILPGNQGVRHTEQEFDDAMPNASLKPSSGHSQGEALAQSKRPSLEMVNSVKPYYKTRLGACYVGDSLKVLPKILKPGTVDLIMTSPPFALRRKKEYGNVEAGQYVEWFLQFGRLFHGLLKPNGSLVIDIGGSWNPGQPTRSLYHYELLIELCRIPDHKFHLAEEFFCYNPARLPTPAEWVTVRRMRVKDAVNCVWWLSKDPYPKADNRKVLQPYSESMHELLRRGYKPKLRPSGHDISAKFKRDNKGSIPPNLLQIANTESNSWYLRRCREAEIEPNPARFPAALPEFFVRFLTDPGDIVLDPFAGSNVTGAVAERLGRRWVAVELVEKYAQGSRFRFEESGLAGILSSNHTTPNGRRKRQNLSSSPPLEKIVP